MAGDQGRTLMVICLFGQRYRPGADPEEEARLGAELLRELERLPGFISYHSYVAEDGEVLGVIRFAASRLPRSSYGPGSGNKAADASY
jgi:hypothetical protein